MDSDFNTKIQKQKISRERRKELKNRLKKELRDRMRFVYIASFVLDSVLDENYFFWLYSKGIF